MSGGAWPFPDDLPVERARKITATYRQALRERAPEACAAIDTAARWVGETWVTGGDELAVETDDTLIGVARAAELTGRSRRWVYAWLSDHPEVIVKRDPVRFRLGDVRDAEMERRAAARRKPRPAS